MVISTNKYLTKISCNKYSTILKILGLCYVKIKNISRQNGINFKTV